MLVEPGNKRANLARAEEWIARAAKTGADVVVLPEALTLGWTHPSARDLADTIPGGESIARLQQAARVNRIAVCAGIIERAGNQLFNSAVIFDARGHLLAIHRKINELDFGRELYSLGDRLGICELAGERVGLMICADGFAPGQAISRSLGLMGAWVILSPCAWAVPADHDNVRDRYGQLWLDNYGPVASEYGLTIVGVSNVGPITAGPWSGRKCIGNSLVVGPGGELLRGPYGESAEELLEIELKSTR